MKMKTPQSLAASIVNKLGRASSGTRVQKEKKISSCAVSFAKGAVTITHTRKHGVTVSQHVREFVCLGLTGATQC